MAYELKWAPFQFFFCSHWQSYISDQWPEPVDRLYGVSTNFRLDLIEPSAREVFMFSTSLADVLISSRRKLVDTLQVLSIRLNHIKMHTRLGKKIMKKETYILRSFTNNLEHR